MCQVEPFLKSHILVRECSQLRNICQITNTLNLLLRIVLLPCVHLLIQTEYKFFILTNVHNILQSNIGANTYLDRNKRIHIINTHYILRLSIYKITIT